jgi:D-alanine-D-alanine ligase-like ATP-grasp enzyme
MPIRNRFTRWRPAIRSRHPSHDILRRENKTLPLLPFKSVIRFGSSKEFTDGRIELNTVEAIKNSSNKLLMKTCFTEDEVKTAGWYLNTGDNFMESFTGENKNIEELPYPIISKHIFGSRGTGNKKHDTQESLEAWMEGKDLSKYIFEKYYSYNREYRLHISKNGCFYTCRKMLQADAPQDVRWYRNDAHCNWILEDNELFDKPVNWDEVIDESVKALKAVGLDMGAVDLRIQSAKNKDGDLREAPKFIVVEINSAASFGDKTSEKYIEELPKLLIDKYENL